MRVLRGEQTTRETFKAQAQASAIEQQQRAAAPRGLGLQRYEAANKYCGIYTTRSSS